MKLHRTEQPLLRLMFLSRELRDYVRGCVQSLHKPCEKHTSSPFKSRSKFLFPYSLLQWYPKVLIPDNQHTRQIANELAQQTMRGGLSAYSWLPLDGIGYSCVSNDGASEVNNVDLFNLSGFPYELHHQDESPRH